ncbi:MAG: GTPase [Chloroflexaceae bacterium]|nr:GTPase [Chloroflexaceae bacterium]
MAVFQEPGITERWSAVQEHLHPHLARIAEQVQVAIARRFPRQQPRYETSFKSQRYINRGHRERSPIEEYHVAFDRPPRGSGILVSVSGAEQAVLVGLQLWGVRKEVLRLLWSSGRLVWQPLVERIEREGQARFARSSRKSGGGKRKDEPETGMGPEPKSGPLSLPHYWIDAYLGARQSSYLWAGFVYPWEHLPDDLETHLVERVLELFPLNEALMEQAELPAGLAVLHEPRAAYTWTTHPNHFAAPPSPPAIEAIIEHLRAQQFTISETTIRAYHVALQTRPLVILAGISGTGKTRLTRLYADAVHRIPSVAHTNPFYLVVSVQPDWHNARDLLGYYHGLTGLYHPTLFLQFLARAGADPQQPYFVCLDEMNLSRPEYYLAPLLSALETTERLIDLGIPAGDVQTVTGETLPNPFRLPLNVCLTGTVNVDESTYQLSDKLLDRANVIELTEVDLATFRESYPGPVDEAIWTMITRVQAIVSRIGHPAGYRTIGEMLRYLEQAEGVLSPWQALDLQIKQKILPKLRGEDTPLLRQALRDLLALFHDAPAPAAACAESAAKVQRMLNRLELDGFTDFYG